MRVDGYEQIGGYAAIGDGRSVALVARDGSVDWLCAPHFDSPAIFAALLDPEHGGRFELRPDCDFESRRRYLPQTNVLETTFETEHGTVRVVDALALDGGRPPAWRELVRRIEADGDVPMRWQIEPRFDFGRAATTFVRRDGALAAAAGPRAACVVSHGAGEPSFTADAAAGSFTASDEPAFLALLVVASGPWPAPTRDDLAHDLEETCAYWRTRWERIEHDGEWDDVVRRSVLALELLADAESGAIVAAPTTSLPERIGGSRNWDYRYVWIRDGGFTLDALFDVGVRDITHRALDWLLQATQHTHPRLQPIYDLRGRPSLPNDTLSLPGYRGSTPVRCGNGAAHQLQLGNWADLLGAAHHYANSDGTLDAHTGRRLAEIADLLCEIWQNDDSGIWELGRHRPYTSSKIASWAALDRALDLAERGLLPSDHVDRWRRERSRIRAFVEERCWSEGRSAYSFFAGTTELDASVLLGRRLGFFDGGDERFRSTLDAILDELADGPLVWRYSGMRSEEGAFLACSFWVVEALAAAGRRDEAEARLRDLVELANDVGLYSEEIAADGDLLGNFPQALTHLSAITAALAVERESKRTSSRRRARTA
jgi:GH15 family glucan-1,4-alpha-glucosidase